MTDKYISESNLPSASRIEQGFDGEYKITPSHNPFDNSSIYEIQVNILTTEDLFTVQEIMNKVEGNISRNQIIIKFGDCRYKLKVDSINVNNFERTSGNVVFKGVRLGDD